MKNLLLITLTILLSLTAFGQTFNLLKIEVEGGNQGFRDETYIHFREGATTGYDPEIEAIKWWSPDPQATMIWTVASDGTNLAINKLPLEDLHTIENIIPLRFVCGYDGGEYILTFSEMYTFDEHIEIILEDKLTGEWVNVDMEVEQYFYVFDGLPDEPSDRYNIHILDYMVVGKKENSDNSLKIYSYRNTVYVKNLTDEKQIIVYDITGREVYRTSDFYKELSFNLSSGIFIVATFTNKGKQTKKIFIN